MKLYLYIVDNLHPKVMQRYKYLLLADSEQHARDLMQDRDGSLTYHCTIVSCVEVPSIEPDTWYLPDYLPENL